MLAPVAMLRPGPLTLLGLALAVGCGGSSESFSEPDGEAGEPGSGGGASGSGGTQGGSAPTGGDAGSVNGGTSGTGAGGTDPNGGTGVGGTETGGEAGAGATGGSSGGFGGTSGFGGSAGFPTGGFGGQVGGSGGFGGAPDPLCPFRPPSGACDPNGLQCRYDIARQCLCVSFSTTFTCGAVDPRCTAMAGAVPPSGDIAIPVSTQTCTCQGGTWFCTYP
jgi:hypothetical protein